MSTNTDPRLVMNNNITNSPLSLSSSTSSLSSTSSMSLTESISSNSETQSRKRKIDQNNNNLIHEENQKNISQYMSQQQHHQSKQCDKECCTHNSYTKTHSNQYPLQTNNQYQHTTFISQNHSPSSLSTAEAFTKQHLNSTNNMSNISSQHLTNNVPQQAQELNHSHLNNNNNNTSRLHGTISSAHSACSCKECNSNYLSMKHQQTSTNNKLPVNNYPNQHHQHNQQLQSICNNFLLNNLSLKLQMEWFQKKIRESSVTQILP